MLPLKRGASGGELHHEAAPVRCGPEVVLQVPGGRAPALRPRGAALTDYLVIYEQGNTSWGAYSPDLPGVAVVGETREEVESLMREAIPLHLQGLGEA